MDANQIIIAFILGEALIFGALAYFFFRKKSAKLALCYRTWGDIIDVKQRSGKRGPIKYPVIRFKAMNGEEVIFESKYGNSKWNIKTSDRLELWVSRDNPSDAEVVNFMAQWNLPIIFTVISVNSIICAVIYWFLKL